MASRNAPTLGWSIALLALVACGSSDGAGSTDEPSSSERSVPPVPAQSPVPVPTTSTISVTSSVVERTVASSIAGGDVGMPSVAIDESSLDGMLLHLPDAPPGARIGDDSNCGGGFSSEGGTDAFLEHVAEARHAVVGCDN